MKNIKMLLIMLFCLAVAVPAMAQETKKMEKYAGPLAETYEMPKAVLVAPKAVEAPAVGRLNSHSFRVETVGAEGVRGSVTDDQERYTMVMEKFVDKDGSMKVARYCEGDADLCKAITGGKVCDRNAEPPAEWCYLEGKEIEGGQVMQAQEQEEEYLAVEQMYSDVLNIEINECAK